MLAQRDAPTAEQWLVYRAEIAQLEASLRSAQEQLVEAKKRGALEEGEAARLVPREVRSAKKGFAPVTAGESSDLGGAAAALRRKASGR